VRALHDRKTRQEEGVVFVEGIRQVLDAFEAGHQLEALLVDSSRLKSERAWQVIDEAGRSGVEIAQLSRAEYERLSSRDNPAGLAATVRWRPEDLRYAEAGPGGIYLATDDVRDPGNLGTIIRSADALGAAGVIVHSGTDPGHPTALRSSLGSAFRIPIRTVPTLNELFYWAQSHGVAVLGSSANAPDDLQEAAVPLPVILLLGNEAAGLTEETLERCDGRLLIPMSGSASSLNVAVAAGILLYEIRRRLGPPSGA
jgi:TrmH family RNA methyltransferase